MESLEENNIKIYKIYKKNYNWLFNEITNLIKKISDKSTYISKKYEFDDVNLAFQEKYDQCWLPSDSTYILSHWKKNSYELPFIEIKKHFANYNISVKCDSYREHLYANLTYVYELHVSCVNEEIDLNKN